MKIAFKFLFFGFILVSFQNCGQGDLTRSIPSANDSLAMDPPANPSPEIPVDPVVPPAPEPPAPEDPVVPPTTQFTFAAADATLSDGMTLVDDAFVQLQGNTDPTTSGLAIFTFVVEVAGEYVIDASVLATTISSNSFYVDIDSNPTADMVWHILPADDFATRRVSRGGTPDIENPEHRFLLTEGEHQLMIRGRETQTSLAALMISLVN